MPIRDRIKELRRVTASSLKPNPKNWRIHSPEQRAVLDAVLSKVGWGGAVIARELGDGSLEIIDGHMRVGEAGDSEIPVLVLDVTEEEADTLLATYDPIGRMAGIDFSKLQLLLSEVETESDEIDRMLSAIMESGPAANVECDAPVDFREVDEKIKTDHACPKCGYLWSGGT